MTERYRIETTDTPPVITERDGRFFIQISYGNLTLQSEIGSWFVSQVFELFVMPRLKDDPAPSPSPPAVRQ